MTLYCPSDDYMATSCSSQKHSDLTMESFSRHHTSSSHHRSDLHDGHHDDHHDNHHSWSSFKYCGYRNGFFSIQKIELRIFCLLEGFVTQMFHSTLRFWDVRHHGGPGISFCRSGRKFVLEWRADDPKQHKDDLQVTSVWCVKRPRDDVHFIYNRHQSIMILHLRGKSDGCRRTLHFEKEFGVMIKMQSWTFVPRSRNPPCEPPIYFV